MGKSNYQNHHNNNYNSKEDWPVKTDTKSILDLIEKIVQTARIVLDVDTPKKKSKPKKGVKKS